MQHLSAFSINKHSLELLTTHTINSYVEGGEKLSCLAVTRTGGRLEATKKMTQFLSCNCDNERKFWNFGLNTVEALR